MIKQKVIGGRFDATGKPMYWVTATYDERYEHRALYGSLLKDVMLSDDVKIGSIAVDNDYGVAVPIVYEKAAA